ncbi:MAG: (d)CMP kinase [Lentisphaeria bacterium]|nr:(d)CMP kinase [Lentisphaeria bacterium]
MATNVIAIDGPAASGKSSVAKRLAAKLNIVFVSTGALYRAIAWKAINSGIDTKVLEEDKEKLSSLLSSTVIAYEKPEGTSDFQVKIDGVFPMEKLHTMEVSAGASNVAKIPEVRKFLLDFQRDFAAKGNWIVMEGRDIGTEIFPDAKYKFFLTAAPEARAKRRLMQDGGTPTADEIAKVAEQIAARDEQDRNRPIAPLKQAEDAYFLDNSELDLEETLSVLLFHIAPEDGGKEPTVLRYRIPYADTDNMGVVYYANYYKFFEMFRTEFMINAGYPYAKMEEKGVALPVIESGCSYKSSAKFEDVIEVTGRIAECKGVRIRIECEIHCRGKLLATGFTVHACLDMKTRKLVKVPAILSALMK